MVFPVVMYGCENWTIKKVEAWRINAFEVWCWPWTAFERPWDSKKIQPVHPKREQSWCSLEGLVLKLKLQYFGHVMWRVDSFEKTLMLGKIEGRKRRGRQSMRWLYDITDSMDIGFGWTPVVSDGQGGLVCCGSWRCKESETTERLNWTEHATSIIQEFLNNLLFPLHWKHL